MGNGRAWLVGILAIIVAAGLWASLDVRQAPVTAAPLAQATATNTPTSTPTRTATPTRNPADALESVQGSRPIEYRAVGLGDGSDARAVVCVSGCTAGSSFPYGAGTPVPVSPAQTQIPGVYTTAVVANPTVALTPVTTPQIAAKPERLYLICTNDSDTDSIYISTAGTAALRQGIRLNAGGAAYEMSERLGNLTRGGVWAASATAGNTLICLEGSR